MHLHHDHPTYNRKSAFKFRLSKWFFFEKQNQLSLRVIIIRVIIISIFWLSAKWDGVKCQCVSRLFFKPRYAVVMFSIVFKGKEAEVCFLCWWYRSPSSKYFKLIAAWSINEMSRLAIYLDFFARGTAKFWRVTDVKTLVVKNPLVVRIISI